MQTEELADLLKKSALAGAEQHLNKHLLPKLMSKAAAYRFYGRTNVDRWIAESLIKPEGKLLDRELLAKTANASNRITYLPVSER
ncbi:hypothetical protein [Mucilaginibacter sp. dw_454]|uniref:hypothetical protein n=1 Tax=Mucilaginibacter sp. dw_454 TaxID=2720079 RepID=UPI001BD3AD48|nr:hypothetical protein [Mucilaginibacter sp. dw_454]